jgi:hypothetical protein
MIILGSSDLRRRCCATDDFGSRRGPSDKGSGFMIILGSSDLRRRCCTTDDFGSRRGPSDKGSGFMIILGSSDLRRQTHWLRQREAICYEIIVILATPRRSLSVPGLGINRVADELLRSQ